MRQLAHRAHCDRTRPRQGAMIPLVGILLVVLIGFTALAVDFAIIVEAQTQLQIAASSAAAGGVLDLPDTSAATQSAIQLAESNMPSQIHGQILVASDIEFGFWDSSARAFSPEVTPLNAVRVTTRRAESNGNPLAWNFARVFGLSSNDYSASAVAALLPPLRGALVSQSRTTVTGNSYIDSYRTSDGPYRLETAGDNGDIVSSGNISVGGSVTLKGDVVAESVNVGTGPDISGDIITSSRTVEFPAIDLSDIESDNDNDTLPLIMQENRSYSPLDDQRNFSLNGGIAYSIPPGDFYFNDLTLSGQSSLLISGTTRIYLTGNLSTSGGDLINSTQDPANLRIFMTGGTVKLNASVDWYGFLYAPNSEISLSGNADLFGAIVGDVISGTGNLDLHFDEDLNAVFASEFQIPNRSIIVR